MRRKMNVKAVLMTGVMCLMLAGCGKKQEENNAVITPDNPVQETQSGEVNAPEDTTISGNNEPEYKNDVSVADLEAAVAQALGENYWPQTEFDSLEGLEITPDMYEEFIYKVPMINVNVDTLLIVKAAEGKVQDVEDKVNAFRDYNINDMMQYPSNLVKIQSSQVVTMGNYVAFVQLGADASYKATVDMPTTASDDDIAKAEMEAITEQNDMAINAMKAVLAK
ncbi:MAG: DUF4358 domain-containing protein [Lachnospiraceae bacterium]